MGATFLRSIEAQNVASRSARAHFQVFRWGLLRSAWPVGRALDLAKVVHLRRGWANLVPQTKVKVKVEDFAEAQAGMLKTVLTFLHFACH